MQNLGRKIFGTRKNFCLSEILGYGIECLLGRNAEAYDYVRLRFARLLEIWRLYLNCYERI